MKITFFLFTTFLSIAKISKAFHKQKKNFFYNFLSNFYVFFLFLSLLRENFLILRLNNYFFLSINTWMIWILQLLLYFKPFSSIHVWKFDKFRNFPSLKKFGREKIFFIVNLFSGYAKKIWKLISFSWNFIFSRAFFSSHNFNIEKRGGKNYKICRGERKLFMCAFFVHFWV